MSALQSLDGERMSTGETPASIKLSTRRRLWLRSGSVCAFPGCELPLLYAMEDDPDDDVVIAKECHIVARSDDGPRGPATLNADERERWAPLIHDRNGVANLVLMCGVHHDVIDSDLSYYTIERVVDIKRAHEAKIQALRPAAQLQRDATEVRYAAIVDEWGTRISLERWEDLMTRVVADGCIETEQLDALATTGLWLLNRVWPRSIPELEDAFLAFRLIGQDLSAVVRWYSSECDGLTLIDRFQGMATDHKARLFLERRSEYTWDLAADLAVELTRAVNLVCERVRQHLHPDYRLAEGHATIGIGMDQSFSYQVLRPLYPVDAPPQPYPGLESFLETRTKRDWHRGEGRPPKGASLPGIYS